MLDLALDAGERGFNRTIEELKFEIVNIDVLISRCFNRTIEELKSMAMAAVDKIRESFNRTIEELKYTCAKTAEPEQLVSIAP